MNGMLETAGFWLADFQLLAALLLAVVVVLQAAMRQPARRMAVTRSTIAALAALAVLSALPGWSLIHLLSTDAPASTPTPLASVAGPATEPLVVEIKDNLARFPAPPATLPTEASEPTADSWTSISWPAGLVGAYACGSAAVLAWLAIGIVSADRVRRRAAQASAALAELLQRIVGSGPAPELLISDRVDTAAAMGVWRPRIILGQSLVEATEPPVGEASHDGAWARSALAGVLAHEWAHIRHGDLVTLAASRMLMVLLWPQPFFWFLRRRMRNDQETLADAAAVTLSGRVDYAEHLLGWAQRAALGPQRRAPRLAGAVGLWEGTSQLKVRVATLLDDKITLFRDCSRRWRAGSALLLLLAASGLSLVTWRPDRTTAVAQQAVAIEQPRVAAQDAAQPAEALAAAAAPAVGGVIAPARRQAEPNVVAGVCVDENGKPLTDVKVTVFSYEQNDRAREKLKVVAEKVTGADGEFRFEQVVNVAREYPLGLPDDRFPQPPIKVLSVVARAAGRAGMVEAGLASWAARQGMAPHFVLSPAARLHGRVTGPDGQPVAGAEVHAGFSGSPDGTLNTARTDTEGRYSIDDLAAFDGAKARADFEAYQERQRAAPQPSEDRESAATRTWSIWAAPQMMLLVQHPDFATKRVGVDDIPGQKDVQLEAAATIQGRVKLKDGEDGLAPAPQATVMLVRDMPKPELGAPMSSFSFQTDQATTDAEGRYRFGRLPAGNYHLMARADGQASPVLKDIVAAAGHATTAGDIVMSPGGVVRFTLTDQDTGKPMELAEGAKIYVNPYPRPELPTGLSPVPSNVVTLSAGAKGELRLPPGAYVMMASVPANEHSLSWQANFGSYEQAPTVKVDEGSVVETTIPMRRIQPNTGPTATLALAGPPSDEEADSEAPEARSTFVPATPPADGPEAPTPQPRAANKPKPENFVRLVVGQNGEMTFEGEKTTWEALPALLEKVANRDKTVLEVAIATEEMSVREANNSQASAFRLARQFKFLYGSYVGVHPLGSKGGDKPVP